MDMPFIWLYQILLCVARLQSQSLNENDCQPFGWNMQTWVQCLRVTCFLYGKFGFDFMLHWIVMWSFQHFHIREINSSFIMFEQWQHFCYGVHGYYHDFITLYSIQSNRLFLNSFLLEFGSGIWLYYCFYGKKIIPNHWNLVKSVNGIYGDIIFTVMWICPLFIKFFTVHFFPS